MKVFMRKCLGLFVVLVLPVICFAGVYFSPFGFSVKIPPGWEVINSKKLLEDPDYKKGVSKIIEHFDFVSKEQREEILRLLKEGKVEYWRRESGGNVNVGRTSGRGIFKRSQFSDFRKAAKQTYPDAVIHDLDLKKIGGFDAMYWEWSGLVYGIRTLTLNVQVHSNEYLQFTLTGEDNSSFKDLRREFWDIMSTFKRLEL